MKSRITAYIKATYGKEVFDEVIQFDWTDKLQYFQEKFDCDDFAFVFQAMMKYVWGLNGVGVVIDWSSGHAYNIVLFPGGIYGIFEPQTDEWKKIGEKGYTLENGIIIL